MALKELPGPHKRVLVDREAIPGIVEKVAKSIFEDYKNDQEAPVLIPVLEGAMEFTVDLGQALYNLGLDCPRTSVFCDTYGDGMVSSGKPRIVVGPKFLKIVTGRRCIVTEDTTETQATTDAVRVVAMDAGALDVRVASLTCKNPNSTAEYLGTQLDPEAWLEGRGMDTAELGRHNPDIIQR